MSASFSLPRRMRRNRRTSVLRELVAETQLSCAHLVLPLFVQEHSSSPETIEAMPGVLRHSETSLLKEIETCLKLGLSAFLLFPVLQEDQKNVKGTESLNPKGLYLRTLVQIRKHFPEVLLLSDVALDPYHLMGHDGLVDERGNILNDETLFLLGDMAIAQAHAGVDIVAPSDMMDGRVAYIRSRLDQAGYTNVGIMSYSAKYASTLYAPFREVLHSAPRIGNKSTYQMDYRNAKEAIEEARLDVSEGADILMVKPAGMYLDIISAYHTYFDIPIAAYQVSGEYTMIQTVLLRKLLPDTLIRESLYSIKRAGAQVILTYFAKEAVQKGILT